MPIGHVVFRRVRLVTAKDDTTHPSDVICHLVLWVHLAYYIPSVQNELRRLPVDRLRCPDSLRIVRILRSSSSFSHLAQPVESIVYATFRKAKSARADRVFPTPETRSKVGKSSTGRCHASHRFNRTRSEGILVYIKFDLLFIIMSAFITIKLERHAIVS